MDEIKYSFFEEGVEMVFAYHESKSLSLNSFRKMTRKRYDLIISRTLPGAKKLQLAEVRYNKPVISPEMAAQMECPFEPWVDDRIDTGQ